MNLCTDAGSETGKDGLVLRKNVPLLQHVKIARMFREMWQRFFAGIIKRLPRCCLMEDAIPLLRDDECNLTMD